MNTKIIVGVVVVIIIAAAAFIIFGKSSSSIQTANPQTQTNTEISPTAAAMEASPSSSTEQTNANQITLTANGFEPATITVKVGDTVTWTNKSGSTATVNSDPHPVHTDFPPLNLGQFSDGQTLSLKFTSAGTHGYHNHFNPSEKGTIIVK